MQAKGLLHKGLQMIDTLMWSRRFRLHFESLETSATGC